MSMHLRLENDEVHKVAKSDKNQCKDYNKSTCWEPLCEPNFYVFLYLE